jgi:hypothetical protein
MEKILRAERPSGALFQSQATPANRSVLERKRLNNSERNMITNPWNKIKATFTRLKPAARILTPLLLALAIPCQLEAAGPAPVNLLSTANFVILAGAAVTTTGGGIINGDVGASPIAGSAIGVTCSQVNGTIYAVDASGPPCAVINATLLTQAKNDLTTAYNDAAGRTIPTATNPGGGNLGGLSLAPGLYKMTTTTLITGSDLTLAGGPNDVWIFQCAQDLQLGSGIKVILTGGAQANNIYWQVGTSAVLGTFSVFNGNILASQAITMDTSSTMNGRALAFSAGVTFNGNGAAAPSTNGTSTGIAVQQPVGTNLVNGDVTNSFGSVAVGNSTNLTFTITNIGSANLTGLAITIDGANSTMFSVTTNPAASLIPGGITTFTVRFAPVGAGVKTAVLHIANNDIGNNNNPFNIAITGTGTGFGVVPGIVVQQPAGTNLVNGVGTINFGSVAVGTSTNLIFTILNIGGANLTGLGVTINGANAAMFNVTTNPAALVAPGGSTTFTVRFAPTSTGAKDPALHIANNDINNNPFNIEIAGTGADPAIIASTNVFVNTSSAGVSTIALDLQTGLFTNSVLLTNSSPSTIAAVRLYVMNLPAGVQVYYASGTTTNGTPYVQYNFPVASGAIVDFTIEYYRPNGQLFPTPTYVPQDATAVNLTVTNGVGIMITNNMLSNGGFMIGFYATPGHSYAVQFTTNMVNWLTADPFIVAPANYVQWIDFGAPKTESPTGTRFYRAFELH